MRVDSIDVQAISFDLFGTLVDVDRPSDPAQAVASELHAHDIPVPEDWSRLYRQPHIEVLDGQELSLPAHVTAALASGSSLDQDAIREAVETAVFDAFEGGVRTRPGAAQAVERCADEVPVGLLSNCSVPGLAEQTLADSDVDEAAFDAVVTSVGCGWRKPDSRAFEAVACDLGVDISGLLHIGDDPATDGGADAAGATSLLVEDDTLAAVAEGKKW